VDGWEQYAIKAGVNPIFITFAVKNSNLVFEGKIPEKQGPFCTPRSLVMLSRVMDQLKGPDGLIPVGPELTQVAASLIGEAAAAQLVATVRLSHALPPYAEIVANPTKTRIPDAPDAQMLVVYELAGRVKESELNSVIQYVDRMPAEFSVTFAKAAVGRDPDLINTDAFGSWCARNASLMASIVQADS
jgi:hypothetical protein